MTTSVQQFQLHLALLDIQQLHDIAARVEEGASTDVMEILSKNVDAINERQGIDTPPMDVLSVEAYKERAQIALEGIGDSLGRIWNAIYTSIGNLITGAKKKLFDSMAAYELRIKDLKDLRASLAAMDQKAIFDITKVAQAKYLVGRDGVFDINTAAKNLEKFDNFFTELSKACAASNATMSELLLQENSKASLNDNPLQRVCLDLTAVSRLATDKDKDYFGYTFGGKQASISTPNTAKVTIAEMGDVIFEVTSDKSDTVRFAKDTASVAEAVKAIDTCIAVLKSQNANYAIEEKLMDTLDALQVQADKFKMSPGMAFLTGAKAGGSVGLKSGFLGGVVGMGLSAVVGFPPLVALAIVAVIAAQATVSTAVGGGVGGLVGNMTDNKAIGIAAGTAVTAALLPAPVVMGLFGSIIGTIKTMDKREKDGKSTVEDKRLMSAAAKEYGSVVRLVTKSLNESVNISMWVSQNHTTELENSLVALTNIARAAIKANSGT
jgi:hypothetical protein